MKKTPLDVLSRFWSSVDVKAPEQCWEWRKSRLVAGGYGQVSINGKMERSNRMAFLFSTGVDPGHLFVIHKCDNPPCCNPNHLVIGTQKMNMEDCSRKGRITKSIGTNNGKSKLNEAIVRSLRAEYKTGRYTQKELAEKYGFKLPTVKSAILGKREWRHVK